MNKLTRIKDNYFCIEKVSAGYIVAKYDIAEEGDFNIKLKRAVVDNYDIYSSEDNARRVLKFLVEEAAE